MNIPAELKYTKDHEWIRVEGNTAIIGITDYAQSELGDIVFVELPSIGTEIQANTPFGTIEAVKAVSDLMAPLTGKIIEINDALEEDPTLVNSSPFEEGWMVKFEIADVAEIDKLLSADAYQQIIDN